MKCDELVSVILPVYNGEAYIEESVRSILDQTYTNLELIVINDDSTDNTGKILSELEQIDNRIQVIETPNNGLVAALNKGINQSSGRYIARMDADDISILDRIEKQLSFLTQHSYDLVGGSINRFSSFTNKIKRYPEHNGDLKANILIFGASIAHPSMFGESRLFKTTPYEQCDQGVEDYGFLVRLALDPQCKIGNYQGLVLNYRVHESQTSKAGGKIANSERCIKALFNALVRNSIEARHETVNVLYDVMKRRKKDFSKDQAKDLTNLVELLMDSDYLDHDVKKSLPKKLLFQLVKNPSLDRLRLIPSLGGLVVS